jgi:hypothetical protein
VFNKLENLSFYFYSFFYLGESGEDLFAMLVFGIDVLVLGLVAIGGGIIYF